MSVENDSDIKTLCGFSLQDSEDSVPHFALGNDEIFQENEVLCLFQILQHILKGLVSQRIVFALGSRPGGERPFPFDISYGIQKPG